MGHKKTTIKEVAKIAGVSIATVSRVLNKNYYVSPDIEGKVRSAVQETGYYPDSIARSLKNNRSYLIGFVVSDIANRYFVNMAKAIMEVIRAKNFNLIVCSTQMDKKKEQDYLETLVSLKISGIILNATGENDELIAQISHHTPVTLIHRRIHKDNYIGDFVDSDNAGGAYQLTRHILSLGHRKIGIILGYLTISTALERLSGIRRAYEEIGLVLEEKDIFYGDFTEDCGYLGAEALMKRPDKPTAILPMNNAVILGALKYFRRHNIRVPEDVSVASFGSIEYIDLMYVQPTLMAQNPYSIGTKAAELILERLHNKNLANREVVFNSDLQQGNSIKKIDLPNKRT
jgi:LacI family transcriptional regulator